MGYGKFYSLLFLALVLTIASIIISIEFSYLWAIPLGFIIIIILGNAYSEYKLIKIRKSRQIARREQGLREFRGDYGDYGNWGNFETGVGLEDINIKSRVYEKSKKSI